MATSIADLFITVSADVGGAMSGLTAVDTKLNGTSTSMAGATAAALPLAAAAGAIGAGFLASIDEAASFEKQMSGIKAVMAPTEVEIYGQALEDLALTLGRETVFSASQAAGAIEELVKAGVPIEVVMNGGAKAATSLAAATGFDLARSAEFAGTALNTFHMDASQLEATVDTLSGVVNASAADMNGLQFAFSAVGPVAAGLGLSFDDTAIALGVFADNGLKGSDAGTSLKTMLLNLQPTTEAQTQAFRNLGLYTADTDRGIQILTETLQNAGEGGMKVLAKAAEDGSVHFGELFKAAKALNPELVGGAKSSDDFARAMGITSNAFFDASGNAKSMSEIFEILKVGTADLTNQEKLLQLEMAFGTDAVRAATIAATEGAAGFDGLAASVEKLDAADSAKTRLDNLKGSMEQMGGSFEAAQITIGQLFLPVIRSVVDVITSVINGFLTLDPSIQTIIVAVVGVTGVITGLTAAFVLLTPLFTAVAAGFGIMTVAASPFLVPLLAIAAAAGALYLAWETNFGGIREVTAEVFAVIQPGLVNIQNALSALGEAVRPVAAAFASEMGPAFQEFSTWVGGLLAQLPPLVRTIGDFLNSIGAIIQMLHSGDFQGGIFGLSEDHPFIGFLLGARQAGMALGDMFAILSGAFDAWVSLLSGNTAVWDDFVANLWAVGERVGEAFGNILGYLGEAFGGIPDLIAGQGDLWQPFLDGAWEIGTRISEAFGNFLGFIGDSLGNIPNLIGGLGDLWEPFVTGAWGIGARLAEAFGNFLLFIGQSLAGIPNLIGALGDFWEPFITGAWEVGTRIAEAFGNFLDFIGQSLSGIPEMITGLGDLFGPFVNAIWNLGGPVGDAIMNVIGFIGQAIGGIPDMIAGLGDIFGGIVSAAGELYNRIAAAIEPIRQLLANTFGSFWSWLTGAITVPTGGEPAGGGGGGGGGAIPAPSGPIVSVGTLIISSESEANAFLQLVADAVLASARRVSPPLTGANPALS